MRSHRMVFFALLALACRREAARPAPRPAPPAPAPVADVRPATPRPFGLIATLLSAAAPTRHTTGWTVVLSLAVSNTDTTPISLGANDFGASRGEDGAVATIDRWTGPTSLAPRAAGTGQLTVTFPASADAPYEVMLRVVSTHANNHPLVVPLPSPAPAR